MTNLKFNQTFDTFIVGPSNENAYAACKAVAEKPSQVFNPLLLYGKSGVGKTHLVRAIEEALHRTDASKKIICIQSNAYIQQLVDALCSNSIQAFRELYCSYDLLILEDIQSFSGKNATQQEFFSMLNALLANKKQIVLTSNCAPKDLAFTDEHLKARLHGGLIVEVALPNVPMCKEILRAKADQMNLPIADDMLAYLGDHLCRNGFYIDGLTAKLYELHSMHNMPITKESFADYLTEASVA